jgi:hypothetical protein
MRVWWWLVAVWWWLCMRLAACAATLVLACPIVRYAGRLWEELRIMWFGDLVVDIWNCVVISMSNTS